MASQESTEMLEVPVRRKVLPGNKARVHPAGWERALELAGGDPSRILIDDTNELVVENAD